MNNIKQIFSTILFLSFAFCFGQNTSPKEDAKLIDEKSTDKKNEVEYTQIFTSVDVSAQPTEGLNSFRKFIANSFKLPEVNEKTIARVVAKFVIWDDGTLRDIQIINETPLGLGLGEEAIRVLRSSPKWTPAQMNGKVVKQYYTLPIALHITPAEKVAQPIKELEPTPKKE